MWYDIPHLVYYFISFGSLFFVIFAICKIIKRLFK